MPARSSPLRPTRRRIHRAAMGLFARKGSTELTVSELAAAAGVARGTIYNQLGDGRALFEEVAEHLVQEMIDRVDSVADANDDPAARMAMGVRFYVQRAHEEPEWGRFVIRFAHSCGAMRALWGGGPGENLRVGIEAGRYSVRPRQTRTALGMIVGGVLSAMAAVCEGEETWRVAGSQTAELILVTLGLERAEAHALASGRLPALPLIE
jgi:AcrR family transcriptional regulator